MNGARHALPAALLLLACGGGAPTPRTAQDGDDDEEVPPHAVALRFEDAGTDARGTPHTAVALVRIAPDGGRTVTALGEETGACYHRDAPNALIAGRCWWAGAGARYVVRREGDAVVALRADVDEMTGEGELAEVGRLEIPADAELQVLAPGNDRGRP
jgi:hypothetical protein